MRNVFTGTKELGAVLLRQVGVATQLAKRVHMLTMPFSRWFVKRPPEYQAGTQAAFQRDWPKSDNRDRAFS